MIEGSDLYDCASRVDERKWRKGERERGEGKEMDTQEG